MITKGITALVALMFSTVCSVSSTFLIDPGGPIFERAQVISLLNQLEGELRISGICLSACTMYLSLDSLCLESNTILGFHSAYRIGENGEPVISELGNKFVMSYYPPAIQEWVIETGALESLDMTYMTAAEAYELGVPACATEGEQS